MLFHLIQDPKEETNIATANSWACGPIIQMVEAFQESVKQYPNVPPGQPEPYTPPWQQK